MQEVKIQHENCFQMSDLNPDSFCSIKITETPFIIQKPSFIKSTYFARTGHWTMTQKLKYSVFIDFHQQKFAKREDRRMFKIFKAMSQFIKTRNPNQCRSHHQKMEKDYKTIQSILKNCWIQAGEQQRFQKNNRYRNQLMGQEKLMKIEEYELEPETQHKQILKTSTRKLQSAQILLTSIQKMPNQHQNSHKNNIQVQNYIENSRILNQDEKIKEKPLPKTDVSFKNDVEDKDQENCFQDQNFYEDNGMIQMMNPYFNYTNNRSSFYGNQTQPYQFQNHYEIQNVHSNSNIHFKGQFQENSRNDKINNIISQNKNEKTLQEQKAREWQDVYHKLGVIDGQLFQIAHRKSILMNQYNEYWNLWVKAQSNLNELQAKQRDLQMQKLSLSSFFFSQNM